MAATPSTMLPLGTPLPSFVLPDAVSGRLVRSEELLGAPAAIVAFICNHCPYVKHIRAGIAELGRFAAARGVAMVAVCSNDAKAYPVDAPPLMAEEARDAGYVFPYLHDATQDVAKAFRAACTPEFYVFDRDGKLAYRGQLDGARPRNTEPVTGADVRAAVEALLAGRTPSAEQTPSIGCNIKWRPGEAPDYFG
ncbi:MAG: thioredoxin family protein [Polyangiaceae bacterium]|nr:thioredoxin family protein [Polyangiaceae bacterium]